MIRQYFAQRCRSGRNPLRVGVIPVGAIFYLQNEDWWRDRYGGARVCRNQWIVEAFLNGVLHAARRNRETGLWEDVYIAGRSDMAVVRSLRNGRRRTIAVRTLILHEDEGLRRDPSTYPDLPNIRPARAAERSTKAARSRSGSDSNPSSSATMRSPSALHVGQQIPQTERKPDCSEEPTSAGCPSRTPRLAGA
jgi:hypothetical protein